MSSENSIGDEMKRRIKYLEVMFEDKSGQNN